MKKQKPYTILDVFHAAMTRSSSVGKEQSVNRNPKAERLIRGRAGRETRLKPIRTAV